MIIRTHNIIIIILRPWCDSSDLKLIAVAVFVSLFSTFEKQVQTATNVCGHCGEKEAKDYDDGEREALFYPRVNIIGLSEIKISGDISFMS